jgi:membrane-associated PAP2 superfamily phosphatase
MLLADLSCDHQNCLQEQKRFVYNFGNKFQFWFLIISLLLLLLLLNSFVVYNWLADCLFDHYLLFTLF